jgi:hypothetical protein
MNNNHDSLTADIIHTFDEASQLLSDSYYADEESELWFCRWRSREYETGAKLVESLMHDDAFMSEDARPSTIRLIGITPFLNSVAMPSGA